jgi:quinol monooxygenase YgiN
MIHVIATITVSEGQRATFLKEFNAITTLVRAESGCIEYGAAVDKAGALDGQIAPRPNTVVIVEKWASVEALRAHLATPHTAGFLARMKPLMKDVEIEVLDPA